MRRFGTALSSVILLYAITLSRYVGQRRHNSMSKAAATDKSKPAQVSGTLVDSSGAVMTGATVQIRYRRRGKGENPHGLERCVQYFGIT